VGNAVVAVRLLEGLDANGISVAPDAVRAGLSRPEWPGRLDLRRLPDGRELLLDAAHNPAGAGALASYLQAWSNERFPLVFAAMRDKDADGMLRALLPAVGRAVFTSASNARAADPRALAELARAIRPELESTIAPTPAAALADAWRSSPRIIVAGSIFLLGDVCQEIGG
jgi:dihydrofolate synthase/folylpolyglutamate synthase